jgi:hypothetical protein
MASFFAALIACSLAACGLFASPPAEPGAIIFADTFENDSGNWKTTLQPDGSMIGVQAGGLRFVINSTYQDYFSILKDNYTDTLVDVDALKMYGPDDNLMGVVCRLQDMENYYLFLVTSDAYYGIARVQDGQYTLLSSEVMESNVTHINQGIDNNHLRVGCVQNALWLEVNGVMLAGLYDDTFTEGKIGLMAGSTSQPAVDILYDNFAITQP